MGNKNTQLLRGTDRVPIPSSKTCTCYQPNNCTMKSINKWNSIIWTILTQETAAPNHQKLSPGLTQRLTSVDHSICWQPLEFQWARLLQQRGPSARQLLVNQAHWRRQYKQSWRSEGVAGCGMEQEVGVLGIETLRHLPEFVRFLVEASPEPALVRHPSPGCCVFSHQLQGKSQETCDGLGQVATAVDQWLGSLEGLEDRWQVDCRMYHYRSLPLMTTTEHRTYGADEMTQASQYNPATQSVLLPTCCTENNTQLHVAQ